MRVAPRLDEVVDPRAQRLDGRRLQAPRGLERHVGLAPSQRPRVGPATPDRTLGAPRIVRRGLLDSRDAREPLVELRALDERPEGHEHLERLRVLGRQVQGQPHTFGRLQPAAQVQRDLPALDEHVRALGLRPPVEVLRREHLKPRGGLVPRTSSDGVVRERLQRRQARGVGRHGAAVLRHGTGTVVEVAFQDLGHACVDRRPLPRLIPELGLPCQSVQNRGPLTRGDRHLPQAMQRRKAAGVEADRAPIAPSGGLGPVETSLV